jgi:uncharacterized protein (DUF1684 family)
MRLTFFSILVLVTLFSFSQNETYQDSIQAFQDEYTEHYENPETSPYKENIDLFEGHAFFPVDEKYKVKAVFKETPSFSVLNTSTSRMAEYTKLGVLEFNLEGEKLQLAIFYSSGFAKDEEYADKAFVPFMDLTSGGKSYTNGRYCYVQLPEKDGDEVILDFNKATNPYCAYVSGYSCTIPPDENNLAVEILAGVKNPK